MQSKIYRLLINCFEDNLGDKIPGMDLQLFLISVKSLVPYEDKVGCFTDIERYKKELGLFKLYKNGDDKVIDNYFNSNNLSVEEDKLLESKILPVVITNTIWDIQINEVLKIVTMYSINKNTLLDAIIISSAIDVYLSSNNADCEMINEITKERVIGFSLKEFADKNNIIMEKTNFIEFEKERIRRLTGDALSDRIKSYKSIKHILNSVTMESADCGNESVLSSFSAYLLKLRKGIISPDKLKLPDADIPEFKEFLKYPSFTHPLLGKCKVIKRDDKAIVIRNKSGLIKVNI
ncbi:hypothetical protein [Sedimentibacter sp.]|uniref:hypothetical protein n=1 Tax=Sedimentibacter sp. TaxID=1960295 RepID=UPI00289978F9|nr:hypothetical protein [Sedimentibacter sp.]